MARSGSSSHWLGLGRGVIVGPVQMIPSQGPLDSIAEPTSWCLSGGVTSIVLEMRLSSDG